MNIHALKWETRLRIMTYVFLGSLAGILAGWFYYDYSYSEDRLFHALFIFAFCGVWLPFMATIGHVGLRSYYASMANQGMLTEAISAHRKDAEAVFGQIKAITSTIEGSIGEGNLDAAIKAVKSLPGKMDELKRAAVKDAVKKL